MQVFVVSLAKYQLVLIILNHVQSFFQVLFNRKDFLQTSSSMWGRSTALHASKVEPR